MKIYEVEMDCITPVWTGNKQRKSEKLLPQSLIGSLRFWLEIYCLAMKIPVKSYDLETFDTSKFHKKMEALVLKENYQDNKMKYMDDYILEAIKSQEFSIPAKVFGCSGWKGLIQIKEIEVLNNDTVWKELQKKTRWEDKNWNSRFGKTDIGKRIRIFFRVAHPALVEKILYPLLFFIQEYGFIGGKSNVGYGRATFSTVQSGHNHTRFDFSILHQKLAEETYEVNNAIIKVDNPRELWVSDRSDEKKIKVYEYEMGEKKELKETLKFLILERSKQRSKFKELYTDGSRILPWVKKTSDGSYKGGLLSLFF